MFPSFSRTFLIIFFLLATGLTIFAYPIIKKRYFQKDVTIEKNNDEIKKEPSETDILNDSEEIESEDQSTDVAEDDLTEEAIDEFLEITAFDCQKECTTYSETKDIDYCKQVCGLIDTEKRNDCEDFSELEKDYCLKDLAIKNQDILLCDKIVDKNIAKTCSNRLWEDMLENSTPM